MEMSLEILLGLIGLIVLVIIATNLTVQQTIRKVSPVHLQIAFIILVLVIIYNLNNGKLFSVIYNNTK